MLMQMKRFEGVLLAFLASTFWGVSGVCVQFLVQHRGISIEWLVTMRLLSSGILLLSITAMRGNDLWSIWRNRNSVIKMLIFGTIGILGVQYTFFAAIKFSNAATATILQYLGPVLIFGYLAIQHKKAPRPLEWISVMLSLIGIFLLVTHGDPVNLHISGQAMFWGILSAFTLALYTLQPLSLMVKYDTSVILGWGFLIGGLFLSLLFPTWHVTGIWDLATVANTSYIIIFGTLLAFYFYMKAVKMVGAKVASLIATVEPLAATVVGIYWLHIHFDGMDWLACACIMTSIICISSVPRRKNIETS